MHSFNKLVISLAALAGSMLLASGTANAHHSKAMFDDTKCLSIVGTVRTLEWVYPHSWLWVIVRNSQGGDDVWGFESMSPAQLKGVDPRWSTTILKKGDKVTVRYSPLIDGRHGGSMSSVTMPDGKILLGAPDACRGAADNPVNPGNAIE